jgi:hypothetical protein
MLDLPKGMLEAIEDSFGVSGLCLGLAWKTSCYH